MTLKQKKQYVNFIPKTTKYLLTTHDIIHYVIKHPSM